MKKKRGSRGAISVFLAIILVPCIVISSVFVDLSRVHLSKVSAESAADLALNALLTNYDADLKDWYGLVASCQTIEQFYDISANYFLRMLSSQGLSDDEIILLSDYYAKATGDDTIYDLLRVEYIPAEVKIVDEVANTNLSNAALMKDQVVEFMKYRAPIEITTGLIERLTSDSSVMGAIEAERTEPLVTEKQEFYESEGELTEAAYHTYLAIKAYFQECQSRSLDEAKIAASYTNLAGYKDVYKEILRYAIGNLSNTDGMQKYSRVTVSKTQYNDYYSNPSKNFSEVYSAREKVDGAYVYYIDLDDVEDLVKDLETKIEAFNTARTNFQNAAQPVLNDLPYGTGDNQTNPIQWWIKMNKAVNASTGTNHTQKVGDAAKNMMRAYSKVLAIDSCELRGDVPSGWTSLEDWKTKYGADTLLTRAESLQSTYLTAGVTDDNNLYLKAVKNLESVSSSQYGNINASNLYVTVDGQRMNLNSALSHISTTLSGKSQEMQDFIDLLDTAIDGDGKDTPSLEELRSYVQNYESNLEDWSDMADILDDTAMGAKDQQEIQDYTANVKINDEDLDVLKTRLVNIRSQLKDAMDAIDSLKWGSTSIKDISSIDTFKSKAGIDQSQIGLTNSKIKEYTDTLFGQKFEPDSIASIQHLGDSSYNPQIDPRTGEVDTPELWKYLYNKYYGTDDGMDQAKSEKDDANKQKDEKMKAAQEADRYSGGGENVPHVYSANTVFGLDDALSGVIGVVKDLVALDFTGMRDDIYATTYVMEMFSYATYENEGKYQLLKDTDPDKITKLTLNNYTLEGYYPSVAGTEAAEKKTWTSIDPQDAYNKSLTNQLINKNHNIAYCAEVEYILCGNNGSANGDNVKAVYNKIWPLRYGLNLISGFANFWNGTSNLTASAIDGVSWTVWTMTSGIIPVPVTKAVLIPIFTVFETASDLDRLQAGFPVELYKIDDTMWFYALNVKLDAKDGIAKLMTELTNLDPKTKPNPDIGIYYSDYLMLFVYLGFNSEAQTGMYQRMAEVIQFNIGRMAKQESYSLQKSRVYFQLNAKLRVKPLMITLPFFSMDEYKNEMTTKTEWCTYDIRTVRGYN